MQMIPRMIAFDRTTGKAIAAGANADHPDYVNSQKVVIDLPTDHYDFLGPINPVGKTEQEVRAEVATAEQYSLILDELLK
jgi:hypothetical protein